MLKRDAAGAVLAALQPRWLWAAEGRRAYIGLGTGAGLAVAGRGTRAL